MQPFRLAGLLSILVPVLAPTLVGCGDDDAGGPCAPRQAIVTDIDETLTTSDAEFFRQTQDPSYDPAERPDAAPLMRGYAERGYAVFYVTARGDELMLEDGRTATEATRDWLVAHDFPLRDGRLFLGHGTLVTGETAVAYKAGVVDGLEADGFEIAFAYGNATTDIQAYQRAEVPDDRIWLVGELAGMFGVQPLPDDQAYTAHLASHLATVARAACPDTAAP